VLAISLSLSLFPEGWVEAKGVQLSVKRDRGLLKTGLDSMNLQTNETLPLVLFPSPSVPLKQFHRYLNQEYSEESAETGLDSMNVANNDNSNNKGCHVSHCSLAICIKKSILRKKKNYGKFQIFSPCKNFTLQKKSPKRNQNPSRYYYNSIITNLKFQHKSSFKNSCIKIDLLLLLPRGQNALNYYIIL
jgi:hypothetical protein